MHIAIIGAGSLGAVYAARLALSGQDVTVIDIDDEHLERINHGGLSFEVDGSKSMVPLRANRDPASVPEADVALIIVNTYSTEDAARSARVLLKEEGYAVTLQNGLGNIELMQKVLGEDRVAGGICYISGTLTGPGAVRQTGTGPTHIGELDGSRSIRLEALAIALDTAGLNPVIDDDIMTIIWGKFVHNCAVNAVCALTDLPPGYVREIPELDEFRTCIIREALALAEASGITLPDEDPVATIQVWAAQRFHRPSMMQHLDRGLPTEIDSLNGYCARESERLGLTAPCNDAITRLMKGREYIPAPQS
jgi:2-dehydropantoate 2-reductase